MCFQKLNLDGDKNLEVFVEIEKLSPLKEVETCFSNAVYEYARKISKVSFVPYFSLLVQ